MNNSDIENLETDELLDILSSLEGINDELIKFEDERSDNNETN